VRPLKVAANNFLHDSRLRVARRTEERPAMRRQRRCFVLAAALWAALVTVAQTQEGPALVPPPSSQPAVTELPAPQQAPFPITPMPEAVLPLPQSAESTDSAADAVPDELLVEEEAPWFRPRYWLDPLPWDTGLELGLNGSSGTNESFSIRAGGYIKRESRFSKLDLSAYHNRTTTGGESTQNNANFDARNDWLLDDVSPWTLYATTNVFYDQFQAFDLQTNANTGVGYRFVHEECLTLIGRLGAGTSREIGGPDDRWVPESMIGFEYNQQLATNQKLNAKLDYFPEWDEVGEYRLVADAGWEIELIQPSNMSLKISATDRFDSTPNGAEPNLVNYSVLLLLKL
jgi:putative salt-induced outer membrane protein YdiY